MEKNRITAIVYCKILVERLLVREFEALLFKCLKDSPVRVRVRVNTSEEVSPICTGSYELGDRLTYHTRFHSFILFFAWRSLSLVCKISGMSQIRTKT